MQKPKRLAVLIDAENVNASCALDLMSMISKLGKPIIKRAYGDWTTTQLMPWKKVLFDLAIKPCQQFRYRKGKNSSDGALMMDAIELLLAGGLDGICIVSADSDFIGLAGRIKEKGLVVYGFGGTETSRAFRVACDEFVEIGGVDDTSRLLCSSLNAERLRSAVHPLRMGRRRMAGVE